MAGKISEDTDAGALAGAEIVPILKSSSNWRTTISAIGDYIASVSQTFTGKTINGASNTLNVRLGNDVSGNLPVSRLNGGSGASSTTFWRGDGSWATPGGSGNVSGPSSSTDRALARFDATSGTLLKNTDITVGDSDGKMTRAAGISLSGTNTGDNASAGYVGEFLRSDIGSGSAVALSTGTPINVTSISLSAGDWDVEAVARYLGNAATTVNYAEASISVSSGVPDDATGSSFYAAGATYFGTVNGSGFGVPIISKRLSLSSTTAVYLVARSVFGVNACSVYGTLRARRAR
ncbi:MAG: hypothetical protein EON54_16535 [Alcaligenaceae bacterium]|nr:MAG: hypothetical protein EON54_16535 [Alcaligenaceae bacterium]